MRRGNWIYMTVAGKNERQGKAQWSKRHEEGRLPESKCKMIKIGVDFDETKLPHLYLLLTLPVTV